MDILFTVLKISFVGNQLVYPYPGFINNVAVRHFTEFYEILLIEHTHKAILFQFRHRDVSRVEHTAINSLFRHKISSSHVMPVVENSLCLTGLQFRLVLQPDCRESIFMLPFKNAARPTVSDNELHTTVFHCDWEFHYCKGHWMFRVLFRQSTDLWNGTYFRKWRVVLFD
jgi:hypothetical protein